MRILGIFFLLLLSLCGMAQQPKALKEYVIKAWDDFQVSEQDTAKAILIHRERVAKYIKSQDKTAKEALQENAVV